MRKLIVFILLAVFQLAEVQAAGLQDSLVIKKTKELVTQVQKKYAPDKRTALFQAQFPAENVVAIETTDKQALQEFNTLLKKEGINLQVRERLLPDAGLDGKIYGVARLSVCNNRTTPGNAAEMATQMILGTPVQVLKKERGYYLVRTPDQYLSYTDDAGVTLMDEKEFASWKAAEKVIFTDDYGYSYQQASVTSMRVSDLVNGNILQVLGKQNDFYKVAYPDKRTAFIPVKSARPYSAWVSRPVPTAAQILETAKTMIGVPYLWGGTSIKGVDCSGFTKTSYFLNGIILPRDASQQALVGEPVDIFEGDSLNMDKALRNLRPGDLLFFAAGKAKAATKPRVTHTAIYIGDGTFIQAAGLVRINSMFPDAVNYDDFQTRTIVGARRMLTAVGKPEVTRVDHHPWY
ncbi:MAG TPA: SH3 domain-containing C40 family peptidase [Sphingobacteriaceae bacterium]